jgi:glycosyltransferase involved in cell wall biosynthesis
MRAYVRNDTFFRAIPLVLARRPEARFVCPAMAGEAQATRWANESGIASAVELLPRQTRLQMADLFRQAQVAVSITEHDGTPNTLLEAMACGCYPVVGDIESLREWITSGVNGSLVAPDDAPALAAAILEALESPTLRESAAGQNIQLVRERAEYHQVMAQAEAFYRQLG